MATLQEVVRAFERAGGEERYYLAQAVCGLADSRVQAELDAARKEVMKALTKGEVVCQRHKVENCICVFRKTIVAPKRMVNTGSKREWTKHQVTPEVSHDMSLTGKTLPKDLAKRLSLALRAQQYTVLRAVRILGGR